MRSLYTFAFEKFSYSQKKNAQVCVLKFFLMLALFCSAGMLQAQTASSPFITKQPVANSTHAKNARLMLYVQALPRDEGSLSYQWYYTPASQTTPLNEGTIASIKAEGDTVPGKGAKQFTLDVSTPNAAGTYYYWCKVTNTNGGETNSIESEITTVTVIDKTLYSELKNGGFQEFWDWNGKTVNNYNMDPSMSPKLGTAFALPPLDADNDQKGMKYWNTTHALATGYSAGKTTQLLVANGLGSNETYLDTAGHNIGYDPDNLGPTIIGADNKTYRAYRDFYVCVELNPDESSSLYQEVATVPGKIYEWSLDHAPRDGYNPVNDNIMSVVIGPAINSEDDYSEGLNYWGKGNGTYIIGPNKNAKDNQYEGFERYCKYPYGSNPDKDTPQSYFRDITQNTTGVGDLNNAINLNNQSGKNFISNYNNRQYYVYISSASKTIDASRKVEWTHRSGVYTVPEGQGLTVFSFVGLLPKGATGNVLDNIVFKSGNNPVSATAMFYLGHVALSAKTEPGYVYGIAEVRGSSVTLLSNDNVTDGQENPLIPYATDEFADVSVSNWFYPNANGTINFNNLTPSKTYRIVGIPIAAVSSTNTNRNPASVLDDGYYTEITIPAAFIGSNTQMATVTSSAQTCEYASIFLTNTDPNVEYAVLEKSDLSPVFEWRGGLGLATGAAIIFDSLQTSHNYIVVGRPANYKEISYADAAPTSGVPILTPSPVSCNNGDKVDDILRSQVTRERSADGKDKITLTGVNPDGEYGIYSPADGLFLGLGSGSGLLNGATASNNTFVFEGLDSDAIYHLAVREKAANGHDTVFMVGVRIYPFPEELSVDYIYEWIEVKADGGNLPKDIQYRMKTDAPDNTWLIGNGKDIDHEDIYTWQAATGTSQLYLGVKRDARSSILDSMQTLQVDTARFYYHLYPVEVDGWAGPYISPEGTPLAVPARPDAPVKNDCAGNNNDYTIDYEKDKLVVYKDSLAYSLNNGEKWTTIPLPANEIALADLGWAAAPMSFALRFPAIEDVAFASEVTIQQLPGRGDAPEDVHVALVENGGAYTIDITNLQADKFYQYREQFSGTWIDTTGVTEVKDLPYDNKDYEIRYAPTCETPASLIQILSVPLYVVPVNFGSIPYGYNKDTIFRTIYIRNVSDASVTFNKIELEGGNSAYFTLDSNGTPGKLVAGLNYNTEYKIVPVAGLPVGNYQTTVKITYGSNTAIADVHLTVEKIQWPNMVEATSSNITKNSFDLCIDTMPGEKIPTEAVIEYSINPGFELKGSAGNAVCSTPFSNLDPASEYTIYYRIQEDANHYASEIKTHTVYTAYELNCFDTVVEIDYINEQLKMKEGILPNNYRIMVDGKVVNSMPYQVSAEAEKASFVVSVERVGPNSNYPPSLPCTFIVNGRDIAPTGVSVDGTNKSLKLTGNFQYRVSGNSNIMANWQNATNETDPSLPYSGYEVRWPATTKKFASKFTTVWLLAPLNPNNKILYVDINTTGQHQDGSSWSEATPSLSNALKYANENTNAIDSIYVAIGTYTPQYKSSGSDDRNKTFTLPSGVVVVGGYDATTGEINKKDRTSILSGDIDDSGDAAGNAYHVVTADGADNALLIGFEITGGNANGTSEDVNGGGIYIANTTNLKLINILIHSNKATGNGGGVYIASNTTSAYFTNLTISGNTATVSGGGIYNESNDFNMYNTIVFGNNSDEVAGFINTNIKNLTTGIIDQIFVDAANNNYHLKKCLSAAVDKGDTTSYKTQRGLAAAFDWSTETDVAGNPRKKFNSIDIGAYENQEVISISITFDTPDAVCAGSALPLPTPTISISGGSRIKEGWLLNNVPYVDAPVTYAQDGDTLKYFVVNECDSTCSDEVYITVMKAPTIPTISAPVAICAGNPLNLIPPTVDANNGTIKNEGWLLNDVIYTNAPLSYAQNEDTLKYFAVNECDSILSNYVLVTVNGVLTIDPVIVPDTVCLDMPLTLPTPNVSPNTGITNEGWLLNDVPYTGENITNSHDGSELKYFAVNECDSVLSNVITIRVKNEPKIEISCSDNIVLTLPYNECEMKVSLTPPNVLALPGKTPYNDAIITSNMSDSILTPGIYQVKWTAITKTCAFFDTCTQWVIVNYPVCGKNDTAWTITPQGDINDITFNVDSLFAVDYHNIKYPTVRIDCNCWTAENLRSTKDSLGNPVASSIYSASMYSDTSTNEKVYGRLYNWESAQKICPKGWVLPTVSNYENLIPLGSDALRMPGSWLNDNTATNSTGFSALPAGCYNDLTLSYYYLLGDTFFWSSSNTNVGVGQVAHIRCMCPILEIEDFKVEFGASIRCIKR